MTAGGHLGYKMAITLLPACQSMLTDLVINRTIAVNMSSYRCGQCWIPLSSQQRVSFAVGSSQRRECCLLLAFHVCLYCGPPHVRHDSWTHTDDLGADDRRIDLFIDQHIAKGESDLFQHTQCKFRVAFCIRGFFFWRNVFDKSTFYFTQLFFSSLFLSLFILVK